RALRWLHAAPGMQGDARLLSAGEREGAAALLLPSVELSEHGYVTQGRVRGTCRQRRGLRAARSFPRPDLRDAGADLPPRHWRSGARRALGRARSADARLLYRLPGIVQPIPWIQLRSAGRVSGTR